MISVIIVTYNSREHIGRCLESLRDSGAEVIVVDNASPDGTANVVREQYPDVKLIASPRNLGFAGGCNQGAARSKGDALLFLNPDVICQGTQSQFADLEAVLQAHDNVVAIAPRLVDSDGRTQVGFNIRMLPTTAALIFELLLINRLFPRNPVNRRYRCLEMNLDRPAEVEQPAAACLLVRRSSFEACRGFDEGFYPLWFEDVDLCNRLLRLGKILYWPAITFEHAGGHSVDSLTFCQRQVYWYRNLLYYGHKHLPWYAGVFVRVSLVCGIGLRMLAELTGIASAPPSSTANRGDRMRAYFEAARLSVSGWK